MRSCPPDRPAASARPPASGRHHRRSRGSRGSPVDLDHPGCAHRAAEQRDLEQLAHGQNPQRQRKRPQVRHRVQVGLVIGHHDIAGGRLDTLKAIHHHARPRRAQPHRRPAPHHPVGDSRVGPGGSAEQHQQGTSQRRQHARDERGRCTPRHPSALPEHPRRATGCPSPRCGNQPAASMRPVFCAGRTAANQRLRPRPRCSSPRTSRNGSPAT